MGIRRSVPLVLAYVLLSAAPALAQVCFRPRPLATCRSTLITEFAVGTRMPSNGPSGRDRYVSTKFGWTGHVALNFPSVGGVGFQLEAFEDEVGRTTDWYVMGRLGAAWGLGGSALAVVLGTIIYGIGAAAN